MQPVTKAELLQVLDDIRTSVAADDSFEGFLNYLMPYDNNDEIIEGADFVLEARYRVGNSAGQGGMRMIGVEMHTGDHASETDSVRQQVAYAIRDAYKRTPKPHGSNDEVEWWFHAADAVLAVADAR